MKLAVCNEMFEGWSIQDVLRFAAQTGYNGVEIAPFTLAHSVADISRQQRSEIRRAAADFGIEVVGLHWLLVRPEGLYINHPDPQVRALTRDYLCALAGLCSDLGGRVLVVGSPKQRDVMPGRTRQETWDWTVEVFRECARVAQDRGVVFCMEPLQPSLTNFVNTLKEAARLVEEVDHPRFQLMMDVCSACGGEDEPPHVLARRFAPLIRHVHVNDANGRGPGFGEVDFVPILDTLRDVGYEGYLSVEVFDFKPDPETIARESLSYLRRCLAGSSGRTSP